MDKGIYSFIMNYTHTHTHFLPSTHMLIHVKVYIPKKKMRLLLYVRIACFATFYIIIREVEQ